MHTGFSTVVWKLKVEGFFQSARTLKQCYHMIRREIVIVFSGVRTGDGGGLDKYTHEGVHCKEVITLNGLYSL